MVPLVLPLVLILQLPLRRFQELARHTLEESVVLADSRELLLHELLSLGFLEPLFDLGHRPFLVQQRHLERLYLREREARDAPVAETSWLLTQEHDRECTLPRGPRDSEIASQGTGKPYVTVHVIDSVEAEHLALLRHFFVAPRDVPKDLITQRRQTARVGGHVPASAAHILST